jgi:hypothetical protein
MTADCLAIDPEKRPTAEQVLLGLQNMGLSDWVSEDPDKTYNYMPVPNPGSQEEIIQNQFPWIRGSDIKKESYQ